MGQERVEGYAKGFKEGWDKCEEELFKRVEAMLIFPFEGNLESGNELERPKIMDMQRTAFNKLKREFVDYTTDETEESK